MGEREQDQNLLRMLCLCVDDGEDIFSHPPAFEKVFPLGYQRRVGDQPWIGANLKISDARLLSPVGIGKLRKATGILHFVQNDAAGGRKTCMTIIYPRTPAGKKFGIISQAGFNKQFVD